jgi:DNA-binding protein H-NS
MPSYQELIAQKNALDKRIEEARSTEAKEALATVKQLIATFGFTSQQVFPWKPEEKKKVEARYYDPESGATWTGRGKPRSGSKARIAASTRSRPRPAWTSARRATKNPFPVQ